MTGKTLTITCNCVNVTLKSLREISGGCRYSSSAGLVLVCIFIDTNTEFNINYLYFFHFLPFSLFLFLFPFHNLILKLYELYTGCTNFEPSLITDDMCSEKSYLITFTHSTSSTCSAKPEELYPHTEFKQNCAKMF